jgi:hypothetical protein
MPENDRPGDIQWDHAETQAGSEGRLACSMCSIAIGDSYYQVNDQVVCPRCRHGLEAALAGESGSSRFARAVVFGSGAAALGAGIYYGILALTGYQFSLVAIVVGWLVGEAVRRGSRGRGGWAYQGLAVFLTYAAIVTTYIPYIIEAARQEAVSETSAAAPSASPSEGGPAPGAEVQDPPRPGEVLKAMAALFALALALPFLGGFQNILGLIIIGIGLYEAWRRNRAIVLEVAGPFQIGTR